MTPASPALTVWSDIGCPWASAALHSLRAAAARIGLPLLIDHRAFPLELFNRQPTPKQIVESELVVLAAQRPDLGWRLWSGADWTYPVTMLPAMEAVQAAKAPEVGGLRGSDELDAALRHAFYAESRCVSLRPVILEVAEKCASVDAGALAAALAEGAGGAAVHRDWQEAQGPSVQGSPHLFGPDGVLPPQGLHNPGVDYVWTGRPDQGGFPRLDAYRTDWAERLVLSLADATDAANATNAAAPAYTRAPDSRAPADTRAPETNGDDR